MCEPTTIILAVTAVASAVGAHEQAGAQNRVHKETGKNTAIAARDDYSALGLREQQDHAAAGQKLTVNALEAARARSSAKVSAGETGLSGTSIDALINDITGQEARNADTIQQNREYGAAQAGAAGRGVEANARNRANSTPPGYFNPFLSALQIGGTVAAEHYRTK